MVLRLCPWRSHNLLPTFGTFHELENSLRMSINGLGNLMGSSGGPRKPTLRWNLKFFFRESISIIKGATYLKKEATKVQRQKSFFFLLKYHMPLFSALPYLLNPLSYGGQLLSLTALYPLKIFENPILFELYNLWRKDQKYPIRFRNKGLL